METLEPFTFSIDWANATIDSLWWIAQAWAISALCTLAVLVCLRWFTTWGRQFWRITRGYFTGRGSVKVWLWLGVLLLSVIVGVRLNVLFSYQSRDMYSAVQVAVQGIAAGSDEVKNSGIRGFWLSLLIFSIMAVLHVVRLMLDLFLVQRFMLTWRAWLTRQFSGDWLDGKAYYRARFIDDTIDNPDQRIQADIDIFTANVGPLPNRPSNTTESTLLFGAVSAVVTLASFIPILWDLAGTLTVFNIDIPRAMFWAVILYVFIATIIAFWIGRPLITLSFLNERFNAAFRYALVRLRDAAEAVAFYGGERTELRLLGQRFDPVVANYKRYINRNVGFLGWNLSVSQAIVPLPWLLQSPRLFAGEIQLGAVTQTATAFSNVSDSLSFFRNAYDDFAGYRAAIIRLHGMVVANDEGRDLTSLTAEPSRDGVIELDSVEVRTPAGEQLVEPLSLRLEPGDALVVTGKSGTGKTTLLRSLAQLWPFASGTLRRPAAADDTMFLSQLPYVPLGDLRTVMSYPAEAGDVSDSELTGAMTEVALGHLVARLDEVADWAKVLSPGEQQRVAFARILLTKPKAVFLDEATSALDEGLEYELYRRVRTALPDTVVVSVSHRSTIEQHHDQRLALLDEGEWQLVPLRE